MHPLRLGSCLIFLACILSSCAGSPKNEQTVSNLQQTQTDTVSPQINDSDGVAVEHSSKPATGPNLKNQACFEKIMAEWNHPFIASSLMMLKADKKALLLNSPADDAIILSFDSEKNSFDSKVIAEKAQISCANVTSDIIQIGLIERNASDGTFSTVVHGFANDFEPVPSKDWRVGVRGFMPDPGTRCAFAGTRELFVVGTRPKNEHVPYHGLFKAQSRSLDFFESTQPHTPILLDISKNDRGEQEILLRETKRDENNKPSWPYVVYGMTENHELIEKLSSDFILKEHSGWLSVTKNGCIQYADNTQICAENLSELTDVQMLETGRSDKTCMLWSSWSHSWIVCADKDNVQTAQIPDDMKMFSLMSEQGTVFWGIYSVDMARPDIADSLKVVEADLSCYGIE